MAVQPLCISVPPSSTDGSAQRAHRALRRFQRGALMEDDVEADDGPITELVHMHKVIRMELVNLEASAMELAGPFDECKLRALESRFSFLEAMLKDHSKAEDEIVLPALTNRLRSLAKQFEVHGDHHVHTPPQPAEPDQHGVSAPYSCDHENEDRFFCAIAELLQSTLVTADLSVRAQLVAQAVHKLTVLDTNLGFHLSREEKELLPLMRKLFTHQEQLQLADQVSKTIPSVWMLRVHAAGTVRIVDPVDIICVIHEAIRGEFKDIELASRRVDPARDTEVAALAERFHTLWNVVKDHSQGEDRVFFPALDARLRQRGELAVSKSFEMEHDCERHLFEELHKLIHRALAPEVAAREREELLSEIRVRSSTLVESLALHLLKEEREILPQLRSFFSQEEQEALMGRIIGHRPSAMLEQMLPWMVQSLSESESRNMMRHIRKVTMGTMFEKWLSCWWVFPEDEEGTGRPAATLRDGAGTGAGVEGEGAMEEEGPGSAEDVEAAIRAVARDPSIDVQAKTARIQALMTRRWRQGRDHSPNRVGALDRHLEACGATTSSSTSDPLGTDLNPTYHSTERGVLGCAHYQRSCKLRAACCGRFFTCRVCHDDASDHTMDRYATREMLCMRCSTVQPVGPTCRSPVCCGRPLARYYCHICKFFDDDGGKWIYHCPFCNICRMGRGLGIDFFHCMRCNACMAMSLREHRCLQNSLESNCPICNQYMFTSTTQVKMLRCGHYMHTDCFRSYVQNQYTCPICLKSLGDMSALFAQLDTLVANDVLPAEYAGRTSHIYCNDCEQKSTVRFHFLYHRCGHCASYNTRVT
eukprot:tig00021464_g21750.t1